MTQSSGSSTVLFLLFSIVSLVLAADAWRGGGASSSPMTTRQNIRMNAAASMPVMEKKLSSIHRSVPCRGDPENRLILKVVYDDEQVASTSDKKMPLVVFLNGADCPHESYMWLAARLAHAGYCVALSSCVVSIGPSTFLISHTFDMSMLQTVEGYKQGPSKEGIASIMDGLETLNTDGATALSDKLDLERIVMGGHSAGGRTTLDLVAFDNPFPIVAAFVYGASLVVSNAGFAPVGTIVPPEATKPPPLLLMGGSEDGISAGISKTGDATETLRRTMTEGFQVNTQGDVDLLIFQGANHMVFSSPVDPTCSANARDRALLGDGDEFRQVMGNTILNFLASHGLPHEADRQATFQARVPWSMVHHVESIRSQYSSTPELSIIDSEYEEQEEAWKRLSLAMDRWISKVVSELGLEPSPRLADNVTEWTAGGDVNVTGTLDAWESSSVVWAVRYANTVEGKDFGKSLGFNVWLRPTTDAPHLTVHVGVRGNHATLMADYLPRFDLATHPQHVETYYGGDRSLAWSELQKSNHVHPFPSVDPAVRSIQSPNALALSVTLSAGGSGDELHSGDFNAVASLLGVLEDHFTSWMGFVRGSNPLKPNELEMVAGRDEAIRQVLCDHERVAGERVMDAELAHLLANNLAGFVP